eukprot:776048-Rhodomonas_salina.1
MAKERGGRWKGRLTGQKGGESGGREGESEGRVPTLSEGREEGGGSLVCSVDSSPRARIMAREGARCEVQGILHQGGESEGHAWVLSERGKHDHIAKGGAQGRTERNGARARERVRWRRR